MISPKRPHQTGFPFVLVCLVVLLVVQFFSSGAAKVSAPLNVLALPQEIQADGYCTLYPLAPEVRAEKSDLIVEGKVISQNSFWGTGHQNIYTANLIEVYKVFKGTLSGAQIEVITEGGTVGNRKQVTTPALELSDSEMGVFFCEPTGIVNPQGSVSARNYKAYGSVQGFIRYRLSDNTASEPFRTYHGIETDVYNSIRQITGEAPREIAENKALKVSHQKQENTLIPNAAAVTFVPTTITAGTAQILTISGSSFGPTQGTGFVEFSNSDNGGATFMRPLATD